MLNQESREDLKVQGACSQMKMETFFFTLHMDGYHVIFLQDKLTLLSNHIVLLFFVSFSNVQEDHRRKNGPDVLHYIVLCYNISET